MSVMCKEAGIAEREISFVESNGDQCPKCGEKAVSKIPVLNSDTPEPGYITRSAFCKSCHYEWDELYTLVGYNPSNPTE